LGTLRLSACSRLRTGRSPFIGGGIWQNQQVIARRLKELFRGEARARARIACRLRQAFVFVLSGRRLPEIADKR